MHRCGFRFVSSSIWGCLQSSFNIVYKEGGELVGIAVILFDGVISIHLSISIFIICAGSIDLVTYYLDLSSQSISHQLYIMITILCGTYNILTVFHICKIQWLWFYLYNMNCSKSSFIDNKCFPESIRFEQWESGRCDTKYNQKLVLDRPNFCNILQKLVLYRNFCLKGLNVWLLRPLRFCLYSGQRSAPMKWLKYPVQKYYVMLFSMKWSQCLSW